MEDIMSKFTDLENTMVKGLLELGAVPIEALYDWKSFSINTKAGILKITLIPSKKKIARNAVLSVFSQFDSPDIAKTLTDCNPFSGKWNFHGFAKNWETGSKFAEDVLNKIKAIL